MGRFKEFQILFLEKTSQLLKNRSFFLEGRMDIDPSSLWFDKKFNGITGGFYPVGDNVKRVIAKYPLHDNTRKDMLILLMRSIEERKVTGAIAEIGVFRGLTAKLIHYYLPERNLFLFDTFNGFDTMDIGKEKATTDFSVSEKQFSNNSLSKVINYVKPLNKNVVFVEGRFPDSALRINLPEKFAFIHLDADLYGPTKSGLDFFFPRMSKGGFIVIHDFNSWPGARKAVEDFASEKNIVPIPMPDKSGSCLILI